MKILHQEFDPPAALRDTVKCFWYNRRDLGALPSCFDVLPDGYVEIIFYFSDGDGLYCTEGHQPLSSPFLTGLLSRPVVFRARGRLAILGIRCFPWAAYDLLGLQPGQGSVRVLEHAIVQLQLPLAAHLHAGRVDAALAQLTGYFVAMRARVALDSMLSRAGAAMLRGGMPVSQVAAAACTTVRTLERKFRLSSGHTVKDVSGLMRFEQARNHLWRHPDTRIAALAHSLGYADQSHLSREFKRYSGLAPAAFARQARRLKQAASGDFVVFVQA